MLDYVKFKILDTNLDKIINSNNLDFKGNYSESTGEIIDKKLVAELHFCKVEVFKSGSVFFYGSIHKLYNSLNDIKAPNHKESKNYKGFNGSQFTLAYIDEVRIYLTKLLHCNPQQMVFENIEIGLNLPLLFNPQKFLTGLLFHNGTQFEHSRRKRLWVALKNDYRIKVYNKSEQYGMPENIMRYELHYDRMAKINQLGIKTFEDISAETLSKAHRLLLDEFANIVYYDNTIRQNKLSKVQINALTKYSNVRYWIDFLPPNKRYEPKQKLNEIITNHSDNLKGKILCKIEKTGVIITRHLEPKTGVINTREFEAKNTSKNKQTGVIITHSSIDVNLTLDNQRICPITSIDISMQKQGSILLSNTGLKHLEKTDKNKFDFFVQTLLTGNTNKFEKDIYSKLSKQIRNRFYNRSMMSFMNQQKLFI